MIFRKGFKHTKTKLNYIPALHTCPIYIYSYNWDRNQEKKPWNMEKYLGKKKFVWIIFFCAFENSFIIKIRKWYVIKVNLLFLLRVVQTWKSLWILTEQFPYVCWLIFMHFFFFWCAHVFYLLLFFQIEWCVEFHEKHKTSSFFFCCIWIISKQIYNLITYYTDICVLWGFFSIQIKLQDRFSIVKW